MEQVCSTDANDELGNGVLFFWLGCSFQWEFMSVS